MDYLKKLLHCAKAQLPKPKQLNILTQEQKLSSCLLPYEKYVYKVQHIVRWEEPAESAFSIVLVNILFWFLTYIQWKFYGLFFALLCSFVIHEAWVEHIWPEIRLPIDKKSTKEKEKIIFSPPEGVLTVSEISHYAHNFKDRFYTQYNRLGYLRATQPPVYCAVVSMGCLVIAGIGTFLSGIALIYLITMACMIIPGFIKHFLSTEHKKKLFKTMQSFSCILIPPEGMGNLDEYMPETTRENLALLTQAGDNNDLSTPTEDSSLGDILMPAYDESSMDTVESLMLPTIPQDSSEDTDSETGALRFKSSHFNGDSTSTDEEISLTKDLVFPDVSDVPSESSNTSSVTTTLLTSGLRQTVAGVLYKTFTSAVSRGSGATSGGLKFQAESSTSDVVIPSEDFTSTSKDNLDSDSEFEIIDSEDS